MVLFAAFATVFGMFALNKLPRLYHSIFKYSQFEKVTSHGFVLCVEKSDKKYNEKEIIRLLEKLGGKNVETIDE